MAKKKGSKTGNYTSIDLGEKVDRALRGRQGLAGPRSRKPWSPGHSTSIGASRWDLGRKLKVPATVDTKKLVVGGLIGTAAQRALRRITPEVFPVDKAIVVDAINFGAGLVPFFFRQDAMTVGVALPGLFQLGGTLADLVLDYTPLKKKALSEPGSKKAISSSSSGKQAADRLRQMAGASRPAKTHSFPGRIPA